MPSNEKALAALAANPFPPSPWVQVTDDGVVIRAGFSDQLLALLRWVPKVRWRPEKRDWIVPLSGAEAVRALLPEILRLAEATQPGARGASPPNPNSEPSPADLFRTSARLIFGGDWQRDTARALNLDETALVRWLAGESGLEDPEALLDEMLALMRRRAADIATEADRLAAAIEKARRRDRP
ncbi:hypothetical protein [Methylocapsa aurea]|uniref:hypothetical protein n=1 Tax=Methylocapsa aurea TaxID=663610 RepID=UPI000560ECAA|nr:hypothetical protein [Methylocapsa aurea]